MRIVRAHTKFIPTMILGLVVGLVQFAHAEITAVPGFPASTEHNAYTPSPALLDVNNDGKMEIFGVSGDAYAFAFDYQGNNLWTVPLPSANCSKGSSTNRAHSSPAIADINGDGTFEFAVGYGPIGTSACAGGLIIINALTGNKLQIIDGRKLEKRLKFGAQFNSVYSTPSISDADGNGLMDVAWGSYDRSVYLYESNLFAKLKLKFQLHVADTVWSSFSFFDRDSDGEEELYGATDISKNPFLKPATPNGGYVYGIDTSPKDGSKKQGFRDKDVVNWYTAFDQTVFSAPLLADVHPDAGKELIIGTGYYFKGNIGKYFKILKLSNGKVLKTIPVGEDSSSQPAAADLDGDGDNELIFTINGGEVRAVEPSTGETIWSFSTSWGDVGHASPIIADLDGNGSREVIFNSGNDLTILDGQTGEQLSFLSTGSGISTPAVGDVDGDGDLEIVALGGKRVFAFRNFSGLGSSPTSQIPYGVDIGMFRVDAARRGTLD